jgi:hypothetical protein
MILKYSPEKQGVKVWTTLNYFHKELNRWILWIQWKNAGLHTSTIWNNYQMLKKNSIPLKHSVMCCD